MAQSGRSARSSIQKILVQTGKIRPISHRSPQLKTLSSGNAPVTDSQTVINSVKKRCDVRHCQGKWSGPQQAGV